MFNREHMTSFGEIIMSILRYIFDVNIEDVCLLGPGYESLFDEDENSVNDDETFKDVGVY